MVAVRAWSEADAERRPPLLRVSVQSACDTRLVVDPGGDVVTADNAEYSNHRRDVASVDELFQGSAPVQSSDDLAVDGLFDDAELKEFIADLSEMRRADFA